VNTLVETLLPGESGPAARGIVTFPFTATANMRHLDHELKDSSSRTLSARADGWCDRRFGGVRELQL
jgi:hypothetical protein